MDGLELLKWYVEKRDFSGSEDDQYAQLLMTLFSSVRDELFPLLEIAHKQGKKLAVKEHLGEINIDDVILA